ncbi:cytochrome c oxidase subunit 3 family protein [Thermopetrobacter sp. TC1]|uniref:cytochrome c oxidase subunit 3 family protein n=1 Tax=Thermopetrobacter sp. TC1 TaxID=1495045 RepID=UPI00057198A2|nr:cytochrome c oxidase subunit 3 family protein [Thermopetrobacter sp. TC1]
MSETKTDREQKGDQATSGSLDEGWGPLSELPGNPMMWLLIISEIAVFGAGFAGFAVAFVMNPDLFRESQDTLNRLAGAINTMVLVTSGLFAALAVRAESEGRTGLMRLHVAIAVLLGLVFLGVKVVEYSGELSAGHTIDTNTFFTLYYLLTGFHALHVVLGIIILVIVAIWHSLDNLETGAAFWHMVDLIWVILFPVVYLLR